MDKLAVVAIDDDENMREILKVILRQVMGCQDVAIFSNSHNLPPLFETLHFQPDIILLDLVIKPLDGFEALAQLREIPGLKRCKFVALTAKVMDDDIQRIKQAGFDGLIGKPIIRQVFPKLMADIANGERIWYVA